MHCLAGCAPSCSVQGPLLREAPKAGIAGQRLLSVDSSGTDDDEDATVEGWLQRRMDTSVMRWLWQSRFFRLEAGPRLLSFYASHIWQGCRREGAYDLTRLVGARARPRKDGINVSLVLEFSSCSAASHSVLEDIDVVELRILGGWDEARDWEAKLLMCIGETLLQACEHCGVYDGFADSAARILARVQMAAVEGRPHVDVNQRRQPGTEASMLMLAAQAGHERVCTHLLMAKADVNLLDVEGHVAAELASSAGHSKIATLLGSSTLAPLPLPTMLGAAQQDVDDVESNGLRTDGTVI